MSTHSGPHSWRVGAASRSSSNQFRRPLDVMVIVDGRFFRDLIKKNRSSRQKMIYYNFNGRDPALSLLPQCKLVTKTMSICDKTDYPAKK